MCHHLAVATPFRRPLFLLGLLILLLAPLGCANHQAKRDPAFAPVMPPPTPAIAPQLNAGAIYQPGQGMSIFEDIKAHRVGDILTVNLVESTTAQKAADTEVGRSQDTEIGNPTLLGQEVQINPLRGLPLTPGPWNLSAQRV